MAEIEEELFITIESQNVNFITQTEKDKIIIRDVVLTDAEAATLAWLINKIAGTELVLELKVKV